MEEKKLKWQAMDIDLHAFMRYIRSKGAASITEIKWEFATDSASVRKVVGFLYHHNKIWLLPHGAGIYVTENTGRKGRPSVKYLRQAAGADDKPSKRHLSRSTVKKPQLPPMSDEAREILRRSTEREQTWKEGDFHDEY